MAKDSSTPDVPSAGKIATAEANANRVTQFTPSGNLLYGKVGPGGTFVQGPAGKNDQAASQVVETPFQKQQRLARELTSTNLTGAVSPEATHLQTADFSGLPAYQSNIDFSKVAAMPDPNSYSADREATSQAQYQRAYNLLQPDIDKQRQQMVQSLADKGLPPGSQAYNDEMDRFDRQSQAQLENLSLSSVAAGSAEQQRLMQDAIQSRGIGVGEQVQQNSLTNAARATGYGERQSQRTQQLQELAALLGGSYNPTPGTAFAPAAPVNVNGAYQTSYGLQNQANQQQQQQQAGIYGALASLGGAALMGFG